MSSYCQEACIIVGTVSTEVGNYSSAESLLLDRHYDSFFMCVSPNCSKNSGSGIIISNLWKIDTQLKLICQRYMLEATTLNPSPSEFKD